MADAIKPRKCILEMVSTTRELPAVAQWVVFMENVGVIHSIAHS
jgi:hypothetical protein